MLQRFNEKNRSLIVNINGRLVPREEAGVSPFDSVVQGGDAVWEGLRLYNGRILAGILWLLITTGFWIGTGGTLGWICHIVAAYCAYSYAKEHPVRV